MTYPVTIVDDFFDDPDEIVKLAEELKWYPPETGNWPGLRTKQLHLENDRLFTYIGEKIHHLYHDTIPDYWELQAHFQKIKPFADRQSARISQHFQNVKASTKVKERGLEPLWSLNCYSQNLPFRKQELLNLETGYHNAIAEVVPKVLGDTQP